MIDRRKLGNFLLRMGLGIIFLVAGIGKLFMGNVVKPLESLVPFMSASGASIALGVLEVVVAIMLLIGLWTRVAGWIAAILLVLFIVAGSAFGMFMAAGLLKDIGLLAGALYLGLVGARNLSVDTRHF